MNNLAIIKVENNKLVLSKEAAKLLDASPNDRLSINYWIVDNETSYPVIAKSGIFTDPSSGNRLTKAYTMSYRGQQKDLLLEYGNSFYLESLNGKKFLKMCPFEDISIIEEKRIIEEEINNLNQLN